MLNGLDLFSGIGGLSMALSPWIEPIAYCENDRYAQAVLLSRMRRRELPSAAIWDDITTLLPELLPRSEIDIIYGGFPCQDISVAGTGKGLAGKRSGLFFEVLRLAEEIGPAFIFLENVPAIRTRGAAIVCQELARIGYDCRWHPLSAQEMGAPHQRTRWFLLAHVECKQSLADPNCMRESQQAPEGHRLGLGAVHGSEALADADSIRGRGESRSEQTGRDETNNPSWWAVEPDVGRVVNGLPHRVDRLRGLGNAVVPTQAREAFKRLIGMSTTAQSGQQGEAKDET